MEIAGEEGVEHLCRYLVHPATGAESITLDQLVMLARLCQHLQRSEAGRGLLIIQGSCCRASFWALRGL